jgi:hypothetical protein
MSDAFDAFDAFPWQHWQLVLRASTHKSTSTSQECSDPGQDPRLDNSAAPGLLCGKQERHFGKTNDRGDEL